MSGLPELVFKKPVLKATLSIKDDSGESPSFYRSFFAISATELAGFVESILIANHPQIAEEAAANEGHILKERKARGSSDDESEGED